MRRYNFTAVEKKWQTIWEEEEAFETKADYSMPKFYALVEFPYPSGQGLHLGHPRPYTALDIVARKRRLEGYNVLFPMGWDAFGLPTENYAIAQGIHPAIVTKENIAHFKEQLHSIGYSFNWSREVDTTDPGYYKWTQWIFLMLFRHGLAYKKEFPINFCPSCKVGLANEEVVDGKCERCGAEVTRKVKNQWMLRITDYAQRLLDDLETVDFVERVKVSQANWIGRSEGADISFPIENTSAQLNVYTTRPDTIYGATYMAIAPEHPLIDEYIADIKNSGEVLEYRSLSQNKSDFERTEMAQSKTGVKLDGLLAYNPISEELIPIYATDYVLMTYGTGAIMAVPAHDERDYEFAKKYGIPIREVISGGDISEAAYTQMQGSVCINSPLIDGLSADEGKEKMIEILEERKIGQRKVNFKLRDWVFSRQRYWGEPIPLIYCEDCGWVEVPESELPLQLPAVDNYRQTDDGDSPLSLMPEWYNTTCPKCGKPAVRETDTMPQWAGSSWYFLRYTDPRNESALAGKEALAYWMNVDWYNGGMEHTTLHLLYSRFWHKFLFDLGIVDTPEPYAKRTSHGMILGTDNQKMSKSRGNVINPDEVIGEYGADTLRMFEMFVGDFEKTAPWNADSVKGCKRFIDRVYAMQDFLVSGDGYSDELAGLMHSLIKKVSYDFENLKFNTAIAAMMKAANEIYKAGSITRGELRDFLILLNPVAPHVTEEIWQEAGYAGRLYEAKWPEYDESKLSENYIEIPIQINGKVRAKANVPADASEEDVALIVRENEAVTSYIEGKAIEKEVYVAGRIYSFVLKQ
ncbi:MAG: leucine--tRNA ligase [Eubacteriaceae bacterium]|nr:leucine--tRNA ligase [Eubacteriaceae bacterium]